MHPTNPEGYVSIIGTNFLYPITTLLEEMERLRSKGPNEVQTSPRENGCAVAIVTLAVLFLESIISRTQYIEEIEPPKKPLGFLKSNFPNSGFQNQIEELFVLRDVIVHNHVWEATFI